MNPIPADFQTRLANIERLLATDPVTAETEADRLLRDAPGNDMVLLFQGIARRLNGRLDAAIEVLEALGVANPGAPLVHLQLGLARRESGDNDGALTAIREAVTANAEFADAWLALADLLVTMGEAKQADAAYASYIELAGRDPQLQQAAAALGENRIADAESLLRRLLGGTPTDVVALCLLADVVERRNDMVEAEALLTRCIELAPGYTRARHNLAVVYLRQNRATEALEHSDKALAAEPDNVEFRKLRAAILVRLARYEESIGLCEKLLDENTDQPTVWTSLGHMLKTVGRRDESVAAYRRAIAQAPKFGEPYWSLANLKTTSLSDADLEAMQRQLAGAELGYADRIHFHFATGKALEDRREFEASFRNYAEGNRLRLERHPYDPQEMTAHIRRSKAFFSAELFSERPSGGSDANDPIFVLGLPRSGSTLVEQILSSHSAVEGTMELPEIGAMAKTLGNWEIDGVTPGYPDVLARLQPSLLKELGDAYVEQTRVHRKLATPFFIDKMPNNFAHVGLIHTILPNSRIIDIRRHPLACGLSLFKEHFARAQNFSYKLETIGRYYRNYIELMAYFDAVLPGRVHHVVYESLVEDTEAEVRRMLDYCELPFEDACLAFYENKRAVSTASSEQVRKPIYTQALEHWRNYEPWLGPLKDELGSLVDDYAGAAG